MPKKAQIISGMVMYGIVILVISKLATNSLNPLEVFKAESLLLKLVVGFLCLLMLLSVAAILFQKGIENERCAKDGLPLVAYSGAHGNPVRCNFCRRWYHSNCFKSNGGSVLTGCKQEPCPTARDEF